MFDTYRVAEILGKVKFKEFTKYQMSLKNDSYVGWYKWVPPYRRNTPDVIAFPSYISTAYFFVNILPIVVPTYLIVFFCKYSPYIHTLLQETKHSEN
jgi:hypothetical protein